MKQVTDKYTAARKLEITKRLNAKRVKSLIDKYEPHKKHLPNGVV